MAAGWWRSGTTEYRPGSCNPGREAHSRAMFGSWHRGITVPKRSGRWRAPGPRPVASRSAHLPPSSSAERSLKEVPALRMELRRPATIATRRRTRGHGILRSRVITALTRPVSERPDVRASAAAHQPERLIKAAHRAAIEQVVPRRCRGVPVETTGLASRSAPPRSSLRLHVCLTCGLAHRAPAAPFLDAPGAGGSSRAAPGREFDSRPSSSGQQVALAVEGQVEAWACGFLAGACRVVPCIVCARSSMHGQLRSSACSRQLPLPYELLTRHPVWRRHCARMALELPEAPPHPRPGLRAGQPRPSSSPPAP